MSAFIARIAAKFHVNKAVFVEAVRPRTTGDIFAYVFVGGSYGTAMISAASHLSDHKPIEHLAGRDGYHPWEAAWKAGMILGLYGD